MSTELSNGVIIPEEYSDDWYDEMSINLRKLNDVITAASDNATDIQRLDTDKANSADLATVATSGSYNDLSNKPSIPTKTSDLTNDSNFVDTSNSAVASGITSAKVTSYDAHVADTDIHVTTADKTKWNNGVSQAYVFRYSSTALVASSTNSNSLLDNTDNLKVGDKVIDSDGVLFSITAIDSVNSTFTVGSALIDLALNANVMHLSGDETAEGQKTFSGMSSFLGSYLGSEASTSFRTCLALLGRFDTKNKSGFYISKFRSNSAQGQLSGSDVAFCTLDVLENEVRTNSILRFNLSNWSGATPGIFSLYPKSGMTSNLGNSTNKWTKFNGLNPGSLSLPNLSAGLDISGYLTTGTTSNTYTALADGYISILTTGTTNSAIYWSDSNGIIGDSAYSAIALDGTNRVTNITFPVNKGVTYTIVFKSVTNIESAKFFPCLGNV